MSAKYFRRTEFRKQLRRMLDNRSPAERGVAVEIFDPEFAEWQRKRTDPKRHFQQLREALDKI